MAGLQGRVFGGFQLAEQMSGGGIADVYRARPNKPGAREVVVKVIYPEFAHQPGFLPRFREIVQSSARLSSHPHILPLIASGEEQGYLFLVTPFVSAGTLRDRMRSAGQLGPADVAPFFRQLCDALAYAHSLGVHHDNVKPSNIFLFEGRHVMLGDFGLLWSPGMMDMDQSGSGAEAVEFLAPELVRGPAGQQADIYGVGAVLFAALTGRAPFHGAKLADIFAAHASQPVPHLAQVNPSLPPAVLALDPVIQRAMAKRPEDRFPSAAAVAQAIETAIQHATPASAVPQFPMAPPQPQPQPMGHGVPFGGPAAPPQMLGQWPVEPAFGANGFAAGGPVVSGPMGVPGTPPALGGGMPMGFGQLNPPFPPLPGNSASLRENPAGQPEIGNLPTARVPAPGPLAAPSHAGDDPAALATIYSPAAQMGRVMTSGDLGLGEAEDETNLGPFSMPAVRPGASGPGGQMGVMSNPGFMVAGGAASWNGGAGTEAAAGERSWNLTGPLGDDRFDNGTAQRIQALSGGGAGQRVSDQLSTEHPAWRKPEGGFDPSEALADGEGGPAFSGPLYSASYPNRPASDELYTDERSRAQMAAAEFGHRGDDRPFSATELELPRLTSPELAGMPPSWQDIVSGKYEVPSGARQPDGGAWSASGPRQRDDWRDESSAWQAQSTADGWESSRVGESAFAPAVAGRGGAADMPWDASSSTYQPVAPAQPEPQTKGKGKGKGKAADDDFLDFDDDRVWTTGHTAIKHKRRRRVRRLVLLLILLLMFDAAALIVSRPDLCPTSGCRQLSGSLHQRFPLLDRLTAPNALAVGASPATVKLTVAPGQSAHTSVTVTNMGALATTEQVSASLPWISADPASSPLGAGSNAQITITARPPANLKAGIYTATVTISNDKMSAVVTLTIAVSAGS